MQARVGRPELIGGPQFANCGQEMGRWNYERSELPTQRNEVFDDRKVLGNGPEGGRVRVRPAGEGPEAEVEPRAAGGEEGESKIDYDDV